MCESTLSGVSVRWKCILNEPVRILQGRDLTGTQNNFLETNITLAITAHDMTSRKLSWQVEHWHFSIQVMKTIFLTWHSMAVARMAMTLVAVMRSLMTAKMTSVLMSVVTVVVTRWSRTLMRDWNRWFWKVAISTGISTTFFIAISKYKYCYTTGETAGTLWHILLFIHLWWTCFHTQKPIKSFSVHKIYNRCSVQNNTHLK